MKSENNGSLAPNSLAHLFIRYFALAFRDEFCMIIGK
jgi:hypothetical protein